MTEHYSIREKQLHVNKISVLTDKVSQLEREIVRLEFMLKNIYTIVKEYYPESDMEDE